MCFGVKRGTMIGPRQKLELLIPSRSAPTPWEGEEFQADPKLEFQA
jgi:hypothetical protein